MDPKVKALELQHILDSCALLVHEFRQRSNEPTRRGKRLNALTDNILMYIHLAYSLGTMHQLKDIIDRHASASTNGHDDPDSIEGTGLE